MNIDRHFSAGKPKEDTIASPVRNDRVFEDLAVPYGTDCTNCLVEASKILGIRVLDHIVFGQTDYYSFADAGLLT